MSGSQKKLNLEVDMSTQTLSLPTAEKMEEAKETEFSIERVAAWTLIFTNAYFLSMIIARLF